MYPQCGWLLLSKLYLNEISIIINILKDKNKYLSKTEIFEIDTNLNVNVTDFTKFKIGKHLSRLFLFQISIWFGALYACIVYYYFVFHLSFNWY